jgi:MFS family permease
MPGDPIDDLPQERVHEPTGSSAESGRRLALFDSTFASLRIRNFRLLAAGRLVSMTGMWMQRIAQDWLIFTLTHSATAVGLATGLQCLPTLLFGVVGGGVGDRFPKRRVLLTTQFMLALLAGTLAVLALAHDVAPWNVYLIAFLLGVVSVVDNPTGQSFVVELVGPDYLRNAISINSSVFQLGGFIGPALAGFTISAFGAGYAFALNALSYLGPIVALTLIRESELVGPTEPARGPGPSLPLRQVVSHPQVASSLLMVAVVGLFTTNLPVTLTVLARVDFRGGAGLYGVLNAVVAGGSVIGALYSARQSTPRLGTFFGYGGLVAAGYLLAAAAPEEITLAAALFALGAVTLLLMTSANSMVQLNIPRAVQGRVMGLYLLVILGAATVGGPLVGLIDQTFGPRWGLVVAGIVPGIAVVALFWRSRGRTSQMPDVTDGPARSTPRKVQ